MTQPTRIGLSSLLVGDELGQIKLVQLFPEHDTDTDNDDGASRGDYPIQNNERINKSEGKFSTLGGHHQMNQRYRIVKVSDECLQKEPAASRAITNIRPIESVYESCLDTTEKPNSLFLLTNKVGQLFICDTDAIRERLRSCPGSEVYSRNDIDRTYDQSSTPILSPIYYNMNSKVPVCGAQPINQTNILVIYQNGDIQHINIGQDILQSSLKIRRKAIRMLGMGYNSDSKAVHWRIDGSSGLCFVDSDSTTAHMDENDPLTDMVLSSPAHQLSKKRTKGSKQNLYNKSPCIKSRKCNEQERLVPTQVINMITSRTQQYKPNSRICKWSSITSLNLLYRKLALYDLISMEKFEKPQISTQFSVNCYKLNDNRLAIGGRKYSLRVYDVQTQKPIYNCLTGSNKNPLKCSSKGEPMLISGVDWLGGNKTTKKSPNMLATCSGANSVVNVYDLRSPKPIFHIDLTHQTEVKWQPYDNHPRGCVFTSICASGAPYSTAVPSQQLALGSTNGQLHIIDLRFVAKSHRSLGKLSGFCGGSVREIRFVSESFEASKMISCATDRFVRIHKIQTSFTSVISQRLATKVFLGTKPTCVQPICDEIMQSYLSSVMSRCGSESHVSTIGSGGWSLL